VRDSDSRFHSSFSAPNLVHRRIRLKFCTAAGKYFPREVGVQGGKREREREKGGGKGGTRRKSFIAAELRLPSQCLQLARFLSLMSMRVGA
jgi:hypothetical protein